MNSAILVELQAVVGPRNLLSRPEDLVLYEYDGSVDRARPEAVVFPSSTSEVTRIVKLAAKHDVPIVGRGAGTGLSGGALPRAGGIMIAFGRMNRILEVDYENRRAVVQPGVVNFDLTRAVEHAGLYFAPDPSSQKSCTIGGNGSEDSGGADTLAEGGARRQVAGMEVGGADGEGETSGGGE